MIPNRASTPQNHPIAKVAVSVVAGAKASMGGMARSAGELCCANLIVLLSCICIVPNMFHAARFHGLRKSAHPKLARPISFMNERLLSTGGSTVVVFDTFLECIIFPPSCRLCEETFFVRSSRDISLLFLSSAVIIHLFIRRTSCREQLRDIHIEKIGCKHEKSR
jgi:hypothetical protein